MSYYKETILKGITELNERSGSSLQAIKKYAQSNLPKGKEYKNGVFLLTIKRAVESGTLVKVKGSYKISAEAKKAAKKVVPKKVAATKKATKKPATKKAPVKKSAPKKKTVKKKAPAKKSAPKKKVAKKTAKKATSKKK